MGIEKYIVGQDGKPKRIKGAELETEKGLYVEPRAIEILVLPPSRFGVLKRRIAVYPEQSARPWQLATGEVKLAVGSFSAQDNKNLNGSYWPTMLARALGLVEKITVKDWVMFILITLNLVISSGGLYLAYKIAKYAHLV